MRRVIIESPFAGPTPEHIDRNLRYLRAAMRDCLRRGESPFASHGLYTQPGVLDDKNPEERALGIAAGFEWRGSAEMTVVYDDLGITEGMWSGVEHAVEIGQPVQFRLLGWGDK
jgi:hypothetical protein